MTTKPLAAAPNLEQIKKQSRELLRAFRAKDPHAAERVLQSHPEFGGIAPEAAARRLLKLADAQLIVAREYGFPSWPRLKHEVERRLRAAGKPIEPARKSPLRKEGDKTWLDGVPTLGWGQARDCTFAGGVESATAVSDRPVSYTDCMGFSGLSFRTRWYQGASTPDCCPSSPVGEFPEEIEAVRRATGWPIWVGHKLGEVEQSMAPYFPEIVSSIDDGRPVLAYTRGMDVCVLYGYVEESERVLTYEYNQPGKTVELGVAELGPWIGFFDEKTEAPPVAEAFAASLRIAVANFRRESADAWGKPGDYRYGADALNAWGGDLAAVQEDQDGYFGKLFFVSWWTMSCLVDARKAASVYLREHADLLGEPSASLLRQAAGIYEREAGLLSRTFNQHDVFLGPWTGKGVADWTADVRQRERNLLWEALALEEKAIPLLEEAVKDRPAL